MTTEQPWYVRAIFGAIIGHVGGQSSFRTINPKIVTRTKKPIRISLCSKRLISGSLRFQNFLLRHKDLPKMATKPIVTKRTISG
jgi:hypothetical protein